MPRKTVRSTGGRKPKGARAFTKKTKKMRKKPAASLGSEKEFFIKHFSKMDKNTKRSGPR
jgi:hypothetical protein